ncbi:MAG TPA: hypothetical protein VMZ71_00800 [Gemmataceae bacterium]|nr:hypothetical protein [Gemmataceae bacterium]
MNQIVVDAEMEKQIGATTVQVVNSKGTVIGVVTPVKFPHSPYTREEIEKVREEALKNPGQGKTIAEVWASIHKKHGENP